mmetsp:Transcript_74525/g.235441  ORF Transcript_74525/g.235441 Transcript_74525/m.235441 type:complete len:422 (+) Transcript_74525:1032-2297(+)
MLLLAGPPDAAPAPPGMIGVVASRDPAGVSGSRPSRATSVCRWSRAAAVVIGATGGGGSSLASLGRTVRYHAWRRLAFHGCSSTSQRRVSEVNVSRPDCFCVAKAPKRSEMKSTKGGPRRATSRVRRAVRLPLAVRPGPSVSSQPRRRAGLASTWSVTSLIACSAAGRARTSWPRSELDRSPAGMASTEGCGAIRNSWSRCSRKRAAWGSCAYASSYSECWRCACKCASRSLSNVGLSAPSVRGERLAEPPTPPKPEAPEDVPKPTAPPGPPKPPPKPPAPPAAAPKWPAPPGPLVPPISPPAPPAPAPKGAPPALLLRLAAGVTGCSVTRKCTKQVRRNSIAVRVTPSTSPLGDLATRPAPSSPNQGEPRSSGPRWRRASVRPFGALRAPSVMDKIAARSARGGRRFRGKTKAGAPHVDR